jgi:hypothetical protein
VSFELIVSTSQQHNGSKQNRLTSRHTRLHFRHIPHSNCT